LPTEPDQLAADWLAAVSRPAVRFALESIYNDAAAAIAARGPACWASGRCCNFEKHGHLLYVTGLEAAYTISLLGTSPLRGEASGATSASFALPQLRIDGNPGGCPFQSANLCTVHTIKPLGCRVYFCDRSAQEWQQELSERLLSRVRAIHEEFGIEYRYGEWRSMLRRFGTMSAS
jgi:Fe-S-cluster containining protein